MDPNFRYARCSSPCLFWIKDTMKMRYGGLETIQRTSRERAMSLTELSNPAIV